MADSFFGFDTSLSNLEDEGECTGELSEDEYDALNNETFGAVPDGDFDWEKSNSQLQNINDDFDNGDLERSLSQLVVDEAAERKLQQQSEAAAANLWPNTIPTAPTPVSALKNVCTVEELERQMRQQQNNTQPFFQPRFPTMILQRPPGLQNPVPLPFAPQNMMQQANSVPYPSNQGPMPQKMMAPIQNNNMMNQMQNNNQMQLPINQMAANQMINQSNQPMMMQGQQMMPNNNIGLQHSLGPNIMPNNGQGQYNFRPNQYQQMNNNRMPQGSNFGPNQMGNFLGTMGPPPPVMGNSGPRPNFMAGVQMYNQKNAFSNMRPQTQMEQPKKPEKPKQITRTFTNSNHQAQKPMSSESLVQLIQNTHPMLNSGMLSTCLHNASNHPLLNRPVGVVNGQLHQYKTNKQNEMNGSESDDSEDPYAGLMSQREKQWLLNIQMLQLNTGTPYIDDYYYTMFLENKKKGKDDSNEAHKANQKNHPFYSGGEVKQRERHNSGRMDEVQQRTYVPTQFENSLGKLQSSSVTAPRKIIDVEVVQTEQNTGRMSRASSVASNSVETPREARRTKRVLLDIEALYLVLLRLEELRKPLAIADALVLREREEKAKQAAQELAFELTEQPSDGLYAATPRTATPLDKRQVVSVSSAPPQTIVARNLLDESHEDLVNKMFAGVLYEDRLVNILSVRKGRMLVLRFLLMLDWSCARVRSRGRAVWMTILRSLSMLARRDHQNVSNRYCTYFRRYIWYSSGWPAVLESAAILNESFDLNKQPYALTSELALGCVSALLEKADTLVQTPEATSNERIWTKFLKQLARVLKNTTDISIAKPSETLPAKLVESHVRLLESRNTVEILKRGSTTSQFADLGKNDLLEQLLKYLCP